MKDPIIQFLKPVNRNWAPETETRQKLKNINKHQQKQKRNVFIWQLAGLTKYSFKMKKNPFRL